MSAATDRNTCSITSRLTGLVPPKGPRPRTVQATAMPVTIRIAGAAPRGPKRTAAQMSSGKSR